MMISLPARWGLPGTCVGEATPALDQPAWSARGVGACISAHAGGGSVAAIPSFLFALLAPDFLLLPIEEIT